MHNERLEHVDQRSWGGLEVATTGCMGDNERGGVAVVLLHGWGVPADALLPVARKLARPRTRFFLPVGPLTEAADRRAWWPVHPKERPAHAWHDERRSERQPHPRLAEARTAVQLVLRGIVERYVPDGLVLGGSSQGGMLALDVAMAASPAIDQVAVLSGALLADSVGLLRAQGARRPQVFASHGRQDAVIPFRVGERSKDLLERNGFQVVWRPFDGGHEVTAPIIEELRAFVFGAEGPG